jgi:hypothetical protein
MNRFCVFLCLTFFTLFGQLYAQGNSFSGREALIDQLFTALSHGRLDETKQLISVGIPVNLVRVRPVVAWAGLSSQDSRKPAYQGKITPLMQAIMSGNPALVALILQNGADPNVYGIIEGTLINYKGEPEASGMWETSALILAAELGDPRIVKQLLDAGANPGLGVRTFGGPRPDPGLAGHDPTRYGLSYFTNQRARLNVLDVLLTPQFRSTSLWQVLTKHKSFPPLLEPVSDFRLSLYYAVLINDARLFAQALTRGDKPDAECIAAMVRLGRTDMLAAIKRPEFTAMLADGSLLASARLAKLLDEFWHDEILGKRESVDEWTIALKRTFMSKLKPALSDLSLAYQGLEKARPVFQQLGHRALRSNLPLALALLFDPWILPYGQSHGVQAISSVHSLPTKQMVLYTQSGNTISETSGKSIASLAGASLLETSVIGTWIASEGDPWTIEIRDDQIKHYGTNRLNQVFVAVLHPWRLAIEETANQIGTDFWPIRVNKEDRSWIYLQIKENAIVVYDPKEKSTVRLNKAANIAKTDTAR